MIPCDQSFQYHSIPLPDIYIYKQSKKLQNGLNSLVNRRNCSIFFIQTLYITLIYHSYLQILFNTHQFLIIIISFTHQITNLLNHPVWSITINTCFSMIPSFSWRACFRSLISFSRSPLFLVDVFIGKWGASLGLLSISNKCEIQLHGGEEGIDVVGLDDDARFVRELLVSFVLEWRTDDTVISILEKNDHYYLFLLWMKLVDSLHHSPLEEDDDHNTFWAIAWIQGYLEVLLSLIFQHQYSINNKEVNRMLSLFCSLKKRPAKSCSSLKIHMYLLQQNLPSEEELYLYIKTAEWTNLDGSYR